MTGVVTTDNLIDTMILKTKDAYDANRNSFCKWDPLYSDNDNFFKKQFIKMVDALRRSD
jgi:hypothetical protein